MLLKLIIELFILSLIILLYYKYIKEYLIFLTPKLAHYFRLTSYFPKHDVEGVLELLLIAVSHTLFCCLLILALPITRPIVHVSLFDFFMYSIYGLLLGIACMGVAGLFCKIIILLLGNFNHHYDLKTWQTFGRGGWIKHHLQSIEILPLSISLTILVMQVGSEEIIFRGLIINYFLAYGYWIAFSIAFFSFVFMQLFLMNKWQSALFPVIGAGVMGIAHTWLYMQIPILWPLIIAHVSFFIFSIL